MSADQKPGRRRAVPEPKTRRAREPKPRPAAPARRAEPARAARPERPAKPPRAPKPPKASKSSKAPKPPRDRRPLSRSPHLRNGSWSLLLIAALAAVLSGWTALPVPDWVPLAGAVGVTGLYAFGLAQRMGGRPLISAGVALAIGAAGAWSGLDVLGASATVTTAVVGSVFAVMSTTPAARFPAVVREVLVATAIAAGGAFAAEAYPATLSLTRTGYLVLGLSLLGSVGLVYRLGAGLHGLGKRGTIMLVSGIGLLGVTLAYTEALSRWGSPGLVTHVEAITGDVRAAIGAMPRPLAALLGFPALAWGVSTRARRRQGWWVTAFGAPALAVVSVSLLNPSVALVEVGLTLLYSIVVGLLLGYLVIRADTFLSGNRGRRARQAEEAAAHRPEPRRTQRLL